MAARARERWASTSRPIPLQYGFSFLDQRYDVDGNPDADGLYSKLDCFIRNIAECLGAIDLNNADSVNAHAPQVTFRSNPYGLAQTFPDGGLSQRPAAAVQGKPVRRQRHARLAAGPVQPYPGRRRVRQVRHDQLLGQPSPSQAFSDYWPRSRSATPRSSRTGSTSATWWCSSACGTTTSTPRASRWSGLPAHLDQPGARHLPAGTDPADLYVPDQSFDYISPRVQVAFPVTERTNFRLSYAQSVQSPDFALCSAASTPTSASPTRTACTARTSTTASRSSSSSASSTPSATTWCWTSRPTTATTSRTPPAAWSRAFDPLAAAERRTCGSSPTPTSATPRARPAAQPPLRAAVQRHARVQLHQRPEHRHGPVHLHQLRVAGREPGYGRQPAAPAGHRADRTVAAAQPGRQPGPHLPERVELRLDGGLDPAELPGLRGLPVRQRHGVHRLREPQTATSRCSQRQVCGRGSFRAASTPSACRRSSSSTCAS